MVSRIPYFYRSIYGNGKNNRLFINAMWIWNDFLLPYLLLGSADKTLSVAIQLTMQGAYGSIDWGGFMAMLVLAIIPIIAFYLVCQKYIIKGVIDGAVKG